MVICAVDLYGPWSPDPELTSSLRVIKRDLQGTRVIPNLPVANWSIHAPLLKNLDRSVDHGKG